MRNFLFIVIFLYSMGNVLAQDELPPSVEPGVIDEKIRREEQERQLKEKEEKEIPTLEEKEKPEEAPPEEEINFLIRQIRVVDNTVISHKDIRKIVTPYENKTLTLSQLNKIAREITKLYYANGYFTSGAFVPPQKIEEGIVEIRVFEGKLGEVVIDSADVEGDQYIAHKILTESGEVIQLSQLETDLLRVNRHPDTRVQGILRPGKKPRTTDLVLKVIRRSSHHIQANMDNQTTRLLGRLRYGAGYSNTDLLGFEDRFNARVLLADLGTSLMAVGSGYQVPFNRYQSALDFGFSLTQVRPQKDLKVRNILGLSQTYSLGLIQPIYFPGRIQVELGLGYDHRSIRTTFNKIEFSNDELRILRTGADVLMRHDEGTTILSHQFRIGIPDIFSGADVKQENFSRPGGGGRFFKWAGGATRVQRLPFKTTGIFKLQTQFTAHKLPTSEFFYLGGMNTVRGYPEGEYLGENAILGNVEILVPDFVLPQSWEMPFQIVSFLDVAEGWLKKSSTSFKDNRYLMGLGGGIRATLFGKFFSRFEMGFPLGNDQSEKRNYAFHFLVSTDIL